MNRTIAISTFAAAVTSTALPAHASTFTVTGTGSSFTISRSGDTNAAETVLYRTVSQSALAEQHFAAGETSKTDLDSTDWETLQLRIDAAGNGATVALGRDYVASVSDSTLTVTNAVTLDIAGHTIDAQGRFCVIEIGSGGDLALTNSVPESGAITGGGDHGVYVGEGGVIRLCGGAIAGNTSSYAGGGLFVDAGGCAWMSGGAITNNACTGYEKGGGGVFVAHDGEFNLSGGVIGGNTADEGGGVYVENSYSGTRGGFFEMVGGEISRNVAQIGGGVFLKRGGEEDVWDEDTGECYQESFDPSVFRMGGGVISGNSAIGSADGYGYAAGIYVEYDDSFFVYRSPVVSGNTNELGVADNVRLASGALDARIGIQGALAAGALIGVTSELDPTPGFPTIVTTGAAKGDSQYFFSDNPNYSVDTDENGQVCLVDTFEVYNDPEGNEIMDPVVVDWLSDNGFTQADIDALGGDSAATDKLYECFLLNCDFRVQDAGATIRLAGIAVSNDTVSVTVQLIRKAPLGAIYGMLYFYGAENLADGFGASPIADTSIDFGSDDPSFDTAPSSGSVTQTATATFSYVSFRFFKAAIGVAIPDEPEEPWEPEEPEDPEE